MPEETGRPIETAPRDSDEIFDVWCDECHTWVANVRRVVYGRGAKKVLLYVPVNKPLMVLTGHTHNPGVHYATMWRPSAKRSAKR